MKILMKGDLSILGFYFVSLTLVIVSLFFLGYVVLRLVRVPRQALFLESLTSIFLGYLIMITCCSLFFSSGKTVNVIYISLLLIAYFEFKNSGKLIKGGSAAISKKDVYVLIFLLLAAFTFGCLTTFSYPCGVATNLSSDYILYARISKALVALGQENGFYYLNTFDSYYNGADPYHYFDLWGAGIISKALSLNSYFTLRLIVYPLFYFMVLLGLVSLVRNGGSFLLVIICGLLTLSGLSFQWYDEIGFLKSAKNLSFNLFTLPKLSFYYLFLINSYLLYKNNYKSLALINILGLPVASIVTAPTVIPACMVALVISYFLFKNQRKVIILQVCYCLFIISSIVIFYFLCGRNASNVPGVEITSPLKMITENINEANFKTQLNILLGSGVHLFILYGVWVIILLMLAAKQKVLSLRNFFTGREEVLVFILSLIFFGAVGWALLYKELNSFQLFSNMVVPLLNTVIICALLQLVDFRKWSSWGIKLALSLCVILLGYQLISGAQQKRAEPCRYSFGYVSKVLEAIKLKRLRTGVSVKGEKLLINPHEKYTVAYPLGDFLELSDHAPEVINIGDFNTPIDSSSFIQLDRSTKAIKDGAFYRFTTSKFGLHPNVNEVEIATKDFVKKLNASFVLLSKDAAMPKGLEKITDLIMVDDLSGERFVTLIETR